MKTDRSTKVLLALVALGLLLNAINPWIYPSPVSAAQAPPANLPMMEVHLRNIDAALEGIGLPLMDGRLQNIGAVLEGIGADIDQIEAAVCDASEAC